MTEDLNNSSAKSVTSYSSSQQNTPVSTQSKALNVSAHHHKIPPAPNLSPMAGSIHPSQTAHQGTLHSSSSVASSNTSPLPSPSFAKDSNHHSTTVSVFHPVSTTATTITSSSPPPPPPTTKKHYSHDESSTSANAVLLGIETLERQQEELERKRRISTQKTPTPPVVERHNPFDDGIASESKQTKDRSHLLDTPQTVFMGNTFHTSSHPPPPQQQQNQPSRQRMIPHQPQDHQMELDHHVPRTVQRGGSEIDDEITMESDLPLTHHQQQQQTQSKSGSLPLHKRSSHSRNASFGSFASKFFKTPMVSVCFVLCLCRGDHLVRRDTDTFHIPSLSLSLFYITMYIHGCIQQKPLKRIMSDDFRNDPTPQTSTHSPTAVQPILFGYLHKLGRNGKWQKRWFESDGMSLRYFKSSSRDQILATLDLLRVGTIQLDYSDDNGCTFTIDVAGRSYYLCADTKERARDWVITLNRVKEARMKIGGLRIVQPNFEHAATVGAVSGRRARITKKQQQHSSQSDSMNNSSDSDDEKAAAAAARVVTTGSRPRTKGLGKDDFSDMEKSLEDETMGGAVALVENGKAPPSPTTVKGSVGSSSPKHFLQNHAMFPHMEISHVNDAVVVRWRKQRSKVQNVVRRLSRWAKRMTMIRCVIQNNVVHFDPHYQHFNYDSQGENNGEKDSNKVSSEGVRYHLDPYNMEVSDNGGPFM